MLSYGEGYLSANAARLEEITAQIGAGAAAAAVAIFPNHDAPPAKPRRVRKKADKVVAYMVQEDDEGACCIVFAKTNMQARREGAEELAGGDWEYVTCRRAPRWDSYAAVGHVPEIELWRSGWWFHCAACETTMDDSFGYCEATDAPLRHGRKEPLQHQGSLFCSPWCVLGLAEQRAERASARRLAMTMGRLTSKLAGCTITDGRRDIRYVDDGVDPEAAHDWPRSQRKLRPVVSYVATFTFPGAQGTGTWDHLDPDHVSLQLRDHEAWKTFTSTRELQQ